MRVQLALNVRDLEEAVEYYSELFGVRPHKRRPKYANFAIDAPPLKLVLFENPAAAERLHHLGVEVFQHEDVVTAHQRLDQAGVLDQVEDATTCCHAVQDKVWSREPQRLRWEWYQITDDDPSFTTAASSGG